MELSVGECLRSHRKEYLFSELSMLQTTNGSGYPVDPFKSSLIAKKLESSSDAYSCVALVLQLLRTFLVHIFAASACDSET